MLSSKVVNFSPRSSKIELMFFSNVCVFNRPIDGVDEQALHKLHE